MAVLKIIYLQKNNNPCHQNKVQGVSGYWSFIQCDQIAVVYQKPKLSAETESFHLSAFGFGRRKLKAEYGRNSRKALDLFFPSVFQDENIMAWFLNPFLAVNFCQYTNFEIVHVNFLFNLNSNIISKINLKKIPKLYKKNLLTQLLKTFGFGFGIRPKARCFSGQIFGFGLK